MPDVDFTTPRGLALDVVLGPGTGAWIRDRHHLLITGPAGIGKSWLASAFVQSACRHGFTDAADERAAARDGRPLCRDPRVGNEAENMKDATVGKPNEQAE